MVEYRANQFGTSVRNIQTPALSLEAINQHSAISNLQ
jgi:hypothetical protein